MSVHNVSGCRVITLLENNPEYQHYTVTITGLEEFNEYDVHVQTIFLSHHFSWFHRM